MSITRKDRIHEATEAVLNVCKRLKRADDDFHARFETRYARGEVCKGGLTRINGVLHPAVWISEHDRYHDVRKFCANNYPNGGYRTNWKLAKTIWLRDDVACVPEYARINRDPEIGLVKSNDSYLHLLAAVAHEVAHALIHWKYFVVQKVSSPKPHGVEWQHEYRLLRINVFADYLAQFPENESPIVREAALEATPRKVREIKRPGQGTKKGRVWEICDDYHYLTRKAIIALCVDDGIHHGTASVTYAEWKRWHEAQS